MQEKYTYGLWGAVAGAIALTVVGFTWGGWSTAEERREASGSRISNRTHPLLCQGCHGKLELPLLS